jgi:hypothetical protein
VLFRSAVRAQIREGALYEELVFCGIVMEHMSDIGMTFEPVECHFEGKVGNANLRLSGYSISEESDQLDLFVSLYANAEVPTAIPDAATKTAVEQCLRFLTLCAEGKMAPKLDPSSDVRSLAETLQVIYDDLEQIRVYVITDRVAKSKSFKTRDIGGKAVRLEVMDIQRLHRHWSEGKPRDELIVDFNLVCGSPLPCVYVPGESDYDYALTAIPAEALRLLYEQFGARLLEANVLSFLSVKGKGVNAGIQNTLRTAPDRFMAYNNGIVIVADKMELDKAGGEGTTGIRWLKGLQIVNGGQTTASIYFTKKKFPETDLSRVRVPAKIIVMRDEDSTKEEALVSDISRYANSQNVVKMSDLSANRPFHRELEKLANDTWCPDGTTRWFYERAAGAYNVMLLREGTTLAKRRNLKEMIPPKRKLTKNDIAKYHEAWRCKPNQVALAGEKNFAAFMEALDEDPTIVPKPLDARWYRAMIAKVILFKAIETMIKTKEAKEVFRQGWVNIATYVVSVVADRLGDRLDLEQIWMRQGISSGLRELLWDWAVVVNTEFNRIAPGEQISEVAKRADTWAKVRAADYSPHSLSIPEIKQ